MKILLKTVVFCGLISMLLSAGIEKQSKPWVAPSWADTIHNPLTGNAQAVADGKKLYSQFCAVCHGDKGKGDGIAAAGLNPKPANHTSDAVQTQTDGAIFWKTTTGRPPMAGYEKTFTAVQRWALVNYIRTLKAPGK